MYKLLGTAFVVLGCSNGDADSRAQGAGGSAGTPSAGTGGLTMVTGSGGMPLAAGGESAAGGTSAGGSIGAPPAVGGSIGASPAAGGTTSRDASAPDAGMAGKDAGPAKPLCVTAGTELCDDFESGHIDAARWQSPKPSNGVTLTVDDVHAHGGKYAVHIHGVADQINNGVLAENVTFPAKNNSFYARIFAYFHPDLPAAPGGDFHTGFIVGSGKNALGDVQAGMGLIGGEKQFLGYSIFYGSPSYEFGPWANTHAMPERWTCLELFENGANPATEIRKVWVDDKELTELESDSAKAAGSEHPNHQSPTFDHVTVGLWEFHPSPTLTDMWVDDVRVSSSKIGCKDVGMP
ncbi:MAG TPA: hypothetical protein VH062_11850 [Polyangiaceae bacterium]|jgi:hypothetical protein|nr:hypothetical protein [Polyangiaceae bacterium]